MKVIIIMIISIILSHSYSNKLPPELKSIKVLNVHVEEPDKAPAVLKRYEGEKRIERDRLREIETRMNSMNNRFRQSIMLQNLQVQALTKISQVNLKMLNMIDKSKAESWK